MTFSSRSITLLLLLVFCATGIAAQNAFQKIYPDTLRNIYWYMTEVPGQGYLIAGASSPLVSSSKSSPTLLMMNADGEVAWQKRYAVPTSGVFNYVIPANGGGYLAVGWVSTISNSIRQLLVVKLDADGNWQWSKTYLNTEYQWYAVRATSDGYVFCGEQYYFTIGSVDGCLFKIDNSGNVVWNKHYGTAGKYTSFRDLAVVNDTIYVVGGHDQQRTLFTIGNEDGDPLAFTQYSDALNQESALIRIQATENGQLVVLGNTVAAITNGYASTWQLLNRDGAMLISRALYRENESILEFPEMIATADGGTLLSGFRQQGGQFRGVRIKTDAAGNVQTSVQYSQPFATAYGLGTIELPDGGFLSIRAAGGSNYHLVAARTEPDLFTDGCCTTALPMKTAELPKTAQAVSLTTLSSGQIGEDQPLTVTESTLTGTPYCPSEPLLLSETLHFCIGDSVQVGGNWYTLPGTVNDTVVTPPSCETITTYTLQWLPLPEKDVLIEFCPGMTVLIGGVEYDQPGTVNETMVVAGACDTLVHYTLQWLPQPTRTEMISFCPGESVVLNGVTYTQPDMVIETVPAPTGCDSLITYFLNYTDLSQPAVLTPQCPPNLTVTAQPGQSSAFVPYDLPVATGDCPCGDIERQQEAGPVSGAQFPLGLTPVCYRFTDDCGSSVSCCFTVKVEPIVAEEEPCDVKNTPCVRFEILGISQNPHGQKTYRLRVTNTCTATLSYVVFQLPDGLTADAPANNSTYTTPGGHAYAVRNANASPFYSIRFKSDGAGLANGQSDVFEYTLPSQAAPLFIHAAARLEGQNGLYETHLNVFDCPVQTTANRQGGAVVAGGDWSVSPNPFDTRLNVTFELSETARVQAVLLDLTGRPVFSMLNNVLEAGPQTLGWNTGHLPAGVYLVGLNIEGSGWTYRKVVLLR